MAQNHDGWDEIFSALPVLKSVNERGYFDITAEKIKEISKREPRLMAKIDFREQLPKVMAAEQLAILAIANGTYRIGRFDPFIEIKPLSSVNPIKVSFPTNIITLNPRELIQESSALDAALLSGILESVFGEKVELTIRGRLRSPDFTFSLSGLKFFISGVQIEVDGGYEGRTTVNLVEAKIGSRKNINVRQLIYPQRMWEQIVGSRKSVKTFVCFYEEPILRFIPISYVNETCMADHAKEMAFILEPEAKLDLKTIQVKSDADLPVLDAPFPQADRFESILAMFSIVVHEGEIAKDLLLLDFDIDPRQIDYYSNAMRWMGLVELKNGIISLTANGRTISTLSHADKIRRMAEIIFSEPIFNHVLRHGTEGVPPQLFERWNCKSETTRQRRLQTVKAWVNYFDALSK